VVVCSVVELAGLWLDSTVLGLGGRVGRVIAFLFLIFSGGACPPLVVWFLAGGSLTCESLATTETPVEILSPLPSLEGLTGGSALSSSYRSLPQTLQYLLAAL
jgi:hypothetical protein